MKVSRQSTQSETATDRGPRARTRRLMIKTATRLMQSGVTPSVSEVAEAAEVSRATAYRYFPSEAALVHAVVDEALGPILTWQSGSADAEERIGDLFDKSLPRIAEFEATFKASLRLSLDQWARAQVGALGQEPRFVRGHRLELIDLALSPLRGTLQAEQFDRLTHAISMIFGIEAYAVLKDICGLEAVQSAQIAKWAACALVRSAIAETQTKGKTND
ncbi:TetR/AcrR family transcriptional regulator [Hoeflea sp.]|uniref:TetR/AcrR family transcriptional regulator n=1 Tax=unclassified Hoeflea TaxID=2614931 RepID=UPI002AFE353B|nr:TetR/AcrR family transcriptional regulator [Hoeflea sp.]